MNEKHPLVSIIIANHNGKGLMAECLDSLSRINYPKSRVEIFMVDNRSDDGSVAFIRAKYKNVKIIENEVNNYCRANNLGIAKSGGEYVILLNNDVRVTDGWLEELVKIMQEDVSVGAATSKLLQENGTIQNAGLYELPNFYWGERGAGKESKDYDTLTEVDALSGASVIYRKKALDEVGPFDEDFVMFGEDVDMSIRLKGKGWRLVCAPSSVAYHKLHGSCDETFARDAIEKNRLLLIAKHHPANLSNALLGSGYFSAGEKNQEAGHIFNLMPAVFLKLAKEHDTQAACGVVRETLAELKRIVNYDTDRLEKDLKNILDDLIQTREDRQRCKDDINRLNSELDNIKEEITNLSNKLRDSVDSGLVKDSTIVELEHKLKDYREKTDNLSNKLRDSVDSGLVKDSTIVELEHKLKDYREETDNLSSKLKDSLEARLELENSLLAIYDSEGYRFILKPLWETIRYCRLAFEYFFRKIYAFIFGIAALFMVPVIAFGVFLCIIERIAEGIFAGFLFSSRKKRAVTSFDDLNISVVIPNYNGIGLLKKCLASIYAADGFGDGNHEVLVVDDASVYDVADCIKDEFPKVHVIRNRRNQGFGRSCNKGVSRAEGELIVLLNNDIIVSKDFLGPLKAHFKDEDVFAVAPKLYYWDRKTFNYGMQMGRFKDGYLNLWNEAETGNGDRVAETAPTVFAVGGAMVFRKNDFLWLGGFDDIYRPNCWEDIDISYRAQKRGLKVLYEPKSLVFHKGGATVNYVRHKEIKNELLFMWKNITDGRMLISHLAYLPGFLYRGKHSSRITFLRGYLWAVDHLIPALINRFRERPYLEVSDKRILDKCMLYYRNFKRNNYIHQRKKTILLITPFILYPLNCGGKLRIYNLYKRLAKNYNLVLLSLIHHADEVKHIPFLEGIFNEVYAIHTKTPSNDIFFPERYKYSFSSFLIERMNEIQERLPVDIVHIESNELLYLTEYVKHIPVVYTEHDVSIISYRSSYYHRGLFDSLSSFVDYLKLVYYHSAIYKNIDHVITLSKQDQKVIDAFSPQAVSSLIPTGVDLEHFKFVEKSAKTKSLIFVGHYPHYPNEEAAVYFCHEILPLIRKAMPEVTVKLIGSCPTEEVIKLSRIKGVELIGEVADVNPYLRDASCFVTAFKRSAGIRGKVLEAMACGTPVVSTTRGAYGIDAVNGKDILIADNPRDFADSVIRILKDDKLYRDIAHSARKLVEDKYGWDKITKKLDSVYQRITQDEAMELSNGREGGNISDNAIPGTGAAITQDTGIEKGREGEKETTVALLTEKDNASPRDDMLAERVVERIDRIIALSLEQLGRDKNQKKDPRAEELHIELTHSCNSSCITCDIWDSHKRNNKSVKDELSLEEISGLIRKSGYLKNIKTVVLSGGEPFLRKDIVDICNLITVALPQAAIGILTNGLDTENIIFKTKEILKNSRPGSLWIGSSLDGLEAAYDKIRGTKGGFRCFVNTVERFKRELPQVKFSVTFVLTPFNMEQLIPAWEFADRYGLDFFAQFGVSKPARSPEVFEWRQEDFIKIRGYTRQIINKLVASGYATGVLSDTLFPVSNKINLLTKIYYWQHLVDFQEKPERFFSNCDAGSKFAMFDPYGNLFFCPILKEKRLGNIREESFDDLWISGRADKIRHFIESGKCSCWLVCTVFPTVGKALALYADKVAEDLATGIKTGIREKNNPALNNEEFRNKNIVLSSTAQGLTLGSNYKCNASCMFCLEGEYKPFSLKLYKDYFQPQVGAMLKQAEYVSFCGMGELLLTADAEEFLDYINKAMPGQNKILTTNGLVFTDAILSRLMHSKFSIQISLHASNAALHSQLTGVKGGFQKALRDIRYLTSHRKNKESPYIVLVFLVNTMNIEDLPAFVEMAASLGVDAIQCNYLTIFKPSHLKLSCFFKQEITNEMFALANQRAQELKISLILPPQFSNENSPYFKMVCSQPWKNIYIDTEGSVLPCCYSGEHFGNLGETDILSIWNNKKYQQLRADLASGSAVKMCKYCLNNNPANVNLLNSHVSFRPDVQNNILGEK